VVPAQVAVPAAGTWPRPSTATFGENDGFIRLERVALRYSLDVICGFSVGQQSGQNGWQCWQMPH